MHSAKRGLNNVLIGEIGLAFIFVLSVVLLKLVWTTGAIPAAASALFLIFIIVFTALLATPKGKVVHQRPSKGA